MKYFVILFLVLSVSCNSFERVEVEGQPDECNDMYTFMAYSIKLKEFLKSDDNVKPMTTLIATWSVKCDQARKHIKEEKENKARRAECIKLIYGPELLSKKDNYKKYSDFLECLK